MLFASPASTNRRAVALEDSPSITCHSSCVPAPGPGSNDHTSKLPATNASTAGRAQSHLRRPRLPRNGSRRRLRLGRGELPERARGRRPRSDTQPSPSDAPPRPWLSNQACRSTAAAAESMRWRASLSLTPCSRRRPRASTVVSHSSTSSTERPDLTRSRSAKLRARRAGGPSRPASERGSPTKKWSICSSSAKSVRIASNRPMFRPSRWGLGCASRPSSSETASPTRTFPRSMAAARTQCLYHRAARAAQFATPRVRLPARPDSAPTQLRLSSDSG